MKEIVVIYDNIDKTSIEICDTINVNKYSNIIYKKDLIIEYIKKIFLQSNISDFIVLNELDDCKKNINYIKMLQNESHKQKKYIYIKSNILFSNEQSFLLLIEKLSYLDNDIYVKINNTKEPIYLLGDDKLLELLIQKVNNKPFIIEQCEILNNEDYLLDISKYNNLVKFLHSDFELRFFNNIIDKGHYLIKQSEDKEKMYQEFSYYSFIKSDMKLYFPSVFDYKDNETYSNYCIEKINIPDMAFQYLSSTFNEEELISFFDRVFLFLKSREEIPIESNELKSIMNNQYIIKVENRLKLLKTHTQIYNKLDLYIKLSTKYNNIDEVYNSYYTKYKKEIKQIKIKNIKVFSHGDLCFSNILYDKRLQLLKLIDPKGALDKDNIYIDFFYDIAKLSHSINGLYDFINRGLFTIKIDNDMKLSLLIDANNNIKLFKYIFNKKLSELKLEYSFIRLLEVSLFLSMLPLHIDNEKKVLALLINGIKILEELE